MIDHISSQVRIGKKEAIPLTHFLGGFALAVDIALLNEDIRTIASNETEEGRHKKRRIEVDLYVGV